MGRGSLADQHATFVKERGDYLTEAEPPRIHPNALHGVLGDHVRLLEKQSEGTPGAIFLEDIVCAGHAFSNYVCFDVGRTRHWTNQYGGVVGPTADGRKGQGHSESQHIFHLAFPMNNSPASFTLEDAGWWIAVGNGLTTGEGLIHAIRDPFSICKTDKETAEVVEEIVDEGIAEKRRLNVEHEFSGTLKKMGREGNALADDLCTLWDDPPTFGSTRMKNPDRATAPRISLISMTTPYMALLYFTPEMAAQGLGNRHLWAFAKRSIYLPDGGYVDPAKLKDIAYRIREAVLWARKQGEVVLRRSPESREIWAAAYMPGGKLRPAGKGALVNDMTGRGEAVTLRVEMTLAALDMSETIEAHHTHAALAVWDYSCRVVGHIWAIVSLDAARLADRLIKHGQISQTDLSKEFFKGNASKQEIDDLIKSLVAANQAELRTVKGKTKKTIYLAPPLLSEALEELNRRFIPETDGEMEAAYNGFQSLRRAWIAKLEKHGIPIPAAGETLSGTTINVAQGREPDQDDD